MKGEINEVLEASNDNGATVKEVHAAAMDAAKRKALTEKRTELRNKEHAEDFAFLERSGITAALANYQRPSNDVHLMYLPPLANETPIELNQQDFDTFFGAGGKGGKILRHGINDAMHNARDASVLIKGPNGKLYTLYMRKEANSYVPVHFVDGKEELDKSQVEEEVAEKRSWFRRLLG